MQKIHGNLVWGEPYSPVLVWQAKDGWYAEFSGDEHDERTVVRSGPWATQSCAESAVCSFLNAIVASGKGMIRDIDLADASE